MVIVKALNTKILGRGNMFIVLAHGFGTNQSVWKYFVPHIVNDFHVVMYDNISDGTTNLDYFDSQRHSSLKGNA
ncbi:unnamed protein product [Lathyrus oleraceus]